MAGAWRPATLFVASALLLALHATPATGADRLDEYRISAVHNIQELTAESFEALFSGSIDEPADSVTAATMARSRGNAALGGHHPYIVMFYAPWCQFCKKAMPIMRDASLAEVEAVQNGPHGLLRTPLARHGGDDGAYVRPAARFAKLDATANKALADRYGVKAYPSFRIVFRGRVYKYEGSWESHVLLSVIAARLATVTASVPLVHTVPLNTLAETVESTLALGQLPLVLGVPFTGRPALSDRLTAQLAAVAVPSIGGRGRLAPLIVDTAAIKSALPPSGSLAERVIRALAAASTGPSGERLAVVSNLTETNGAQPYVGPWADSDGSADPLDHNAPLIPAVDEWLEQRKYDQADTGGDPIAVKAATAGGIAGLFVTRGGDPSSPVVLREWAAAVALLQRAVQRFNGKRVRAALGVQADGPLPPRWASAVDLRLPPTAAFTVINGGLATDLDDTFGLQGSDLPALVLYDGTWELTWPLPAATNAAVLRTLQVAREQSSPAAWQAQAEEAAPMLAEALFDLIPDTALTGGPAAVHGPTAAPVVSSAAERHARAVPRTSVAALVHTIRRYLPAPLSGLEWVLERAVTLGPGQLAAFVFIPLIILALSGYALICAPGAGSPALEPLPPALERLTYREILAMPTAQRRALVESLSPGQQMALHFKLDREMAAVGKKKKNN